LGVIIFSEVLGITMTSTAWQAGKQTMDRKNINRGFNKLRVWQDAISLYVLAYKIFSKFPFELMKVKPFINLKTLRSP
jgi:hypothetical protein